MDIRIPPKLGELRAMTAGLQNTETDLQARTLK